ncbi:MAG: PH domain-containing protein [Acidobacteriaceae bacterium]
MDSGLQLAIFGLLAAVVLAAIGCAPQRTDVAGDDLRVHTWLKTFHFNLDEVRSAEEIEPDELSWRNTFRLCAVGWPLKPYGYLWNRERGLLLAMVSDRSGMVLLDTGKKLILVSPENPRDLVLEMQNRPA